MKKYWTIIKIYWERGLAYRFTVLTYRIGEIAMVLVQVLLWRTIYTSQDIIKGFSLNEMITYVLVGTLFQVMVRNFMKEYVARDIKAGRLSVMLIKPISFFRYALTREIGRTSLPFFMSLISQALLVALFHNVIVFNTSLMHLAVILVMLILAFITELFLSFLLGLIAFWFVEVDGLFGTINGLKKFFSGGYFPLSLLPAAFIKASFLLPFAYSFFMPVQLYLQKIDLITGLKGIGVQIVWIVLLRIIIKIAWKKGLRQYESVGI